MARKQGRTSTGYSLEERPRASGKPHWRVRIWVADAASGRKKLQVVGTYATRTEAQKEGSRAVEERERGTLLKPNTTTVAELADLWLAQELPKTVAPENREVYRIICDRHIKPAVGTTRVQILETQAVDTFYAKLEEAGYSTSLIRKCHLRLRSIMKLAVRWKWIAHNPCDDATVPKVSYREADVWTPVETGKFLQAAEKDRLSPYWLLAVETGARTSELLGLGWEDFDTERGSVTIGRQAVRLLKGAPILKLGPKTAAGRRTVRLTDAMRDALKAHNTRQIAVRKTSEGWQDNGLIFPTSSGRPVNPRHVLRSFDRLVKTAGVKKLTPHGMRKSHITALIAAGANIKAVAARVGHRDITTTLRTYTALTQPMQDELHQAVEALAALHGRDEGQQAAAD